MGGIEGGGGSRDQPLIKLIRFCMQTYLEVKQYPEQLSEVVELVRVSGPVST